jgi:TatA/E family protein of Tat protein translocase
MFGHFPELLLILLVGLLVFGPEKLPEIAANAGKMLREVRQAYETTMHPVTEPEPDDFTQYYYESLARSGETVPEVAADDQHLDLWPGIGGTESVEMAMGEGEVHAGEVHGAGEHGPAADAEPPAGSASA